MRQLTPRQKEILHMIQEFIADYGMPPTRADIARELGLKSANAAEEHLRALQKKGVLELADGCAVDQTAVAKVKVQVDARKWSAAARRIRKGALRWISSIAAHCASLVLWITPSQV